jgi:hypothetical protein
VKLIDNAATGESKDYQARLIKGNRDNANPGSFFSIREQRARASRPDVDRVVH